MVTLKEYEIYLKVKAFIEAEGCDVGKVGSRCLKSSGSINFIWDKINSFQNFGIRWIPRYPREIV